MPMPTADCRLGLETLRLTDPTHEMSAELAPARGALLLSLQKAGREFMYCDPQNLASPERPRCGMPVLFPCCGRNTGDRVRFDGRDYPMPIHGFAHTSAWAAEALRGCTGADGADAGFTLPAGPETGRLFAQGSGEARFANTGAGRRVRLERSAGFDTLVFWSVPDKGFLCVEPWQGQPDDLAAGGSCQLAPGEEAEGWVRIIPELTGEQD